MTIVPKRDPAERVLVDRICAGDAAAFEQLFRAYHVELRDFAARYVGSTSTGEELVHDLFVMIWARRAEWQVHGSLRGYLFSAVRNRAVSEIRRAILERRWRDSPEHAVEAERHDENPAERNLEREERIRLVARVLEELPERCRIAVTLRWHRQLSYAEIAEVMGIAIKTVEIYLTRGANALRTRYKEAFD